MNLSNEDKSWFLEQLQSVETRMIDLNTLTNDRIEKVATRMIDLNTRTNDRIERVEAALLTEFHKWASPTDVRLKSHTALLRALDAEMETITERLDKLENKSS